jgi:CRISPR-associated exonuclease Cas4
MCFLVALIILIAAVLAWLIGHRLLARTGLPLRNILYADVGSSFPQSESLRSLRYGLIGKPDYLVRLPEGIAPIEVKSCRAPASGRPYEGHLFQLAAYCLLVEDVFGVQVPHGLVNYEDRSIQVDFTPSLRASLLELLNEMRAAKGGEELHIDHNRPGKCRSCGFRTVCGESLV